MKAFPPNISLQELTHSATAIRRGIDNEPETDQHLRNLNKTAWWLQTLRQYIHDETGKETPIIVSSGYRSHDLNKAIGGSDTSVHKIGFGADITAPGLSPIDLADLAARCMAAHGYDQIIHEFGRWVHVGVLGPDGKRQKQQTLTAFKNTNGLTEYKPGLHEV